MDKNKLFIGLIILAGAIIVGFLVISNPNNTNLAGNPIGPNLSKGSNATVVATTTAKLILAEASYAKMRVISNVGFYDAWISATTTNLAANYGFWLKASSSVIMTGDSLFTGAIYGIGSGTTTISIFQF